MRSNCRTAAAGSVRIRVRPGRLRRSGAVDAVVHAHRNTFGLTYITHIEKSGESETSTCSCAGNSQTSVLRANGRRRPSTR